MTERWKIHAALVTIQSEYTRVSDLCIHLPLHITNAWIWTGFIRCNAFCYNKVMTCHTLTWIWKI